MLSERADPSAAILVRGGRLVTSISAAS